jgi:hypothetical protein
MLPAIPICLVLAHPNAGAYSSFVITKTGDVAAWGLNYSGQLGMAKESEEDNLKWEPVKVGSTVKHGIGILGRVTPGPPPDDSPGCQYTMSSTTH